MINPNPLTRMSPFVNPQIPYGNMNWNINAQQQMNFPQNNLPKNINPPMNEIKPPNSNEILDQNIPQPPEPEPDIQ
jgi:hypothetical protein